MVRGQERLGQSEFKGASERARVQKLFRKEGVGEWAYVTLETAGIRE